MGVHGITRFLQERGILPSASSSDGASDCCSTQLWNEWKPSMAFRETAEDSPPRVVIPPGSTLLVDGNGLAFYLHEIAYARYVRSKTSPKDRSVKSPGGASCPPIEALKAKEIADCLPIMMPLELIAELAHEFVAGLQDQGVDLQFFWDGPSRRFKSVTNRRRKLQREQAWATLQTFCNHGSIPLRQTDPVCHCHKHFPKSSLFLLCVKQALQTMTPSVTMVDTAEEADLELAYRASGDPTCFVLGQDSDFLFYKDIQYVPFSGIYISSSKRGQRMPMQAICLTRETIARKLGLDDADMVELAILLGNDYVDKRTLAIPVHLDDVAAAADFLRNQKTDDYKVPSKSDSESALEYVRCLYNLAGVESFPPDEEFEPSSHSTDEAVENEIEQLISFPKNFPTHLAKVSSHHKSVAEVVENCLQVFIDENSDEERSAPLLQPCHLQAYRTSIAPSTNLLRIPPLEERPLWANIQAATIIERCITRVLKASSKTILGHRTPPSCLMNHIRFHTTLAKLQPRHGSPSKTTSPGIDSTPRSESPAQMVERPSLPIDEHEDKILETIRKNRVTIIHGETGCGKSSRVPIMLLETPSPESSLPNVKMFISQPRRIAAKSLVERVRSCEPEHRDKFAVRMGHGYREYETHKTQAWFVTTGYLTRLLARHPERFNDVTHLIIDEVHERSVDTDILCLLCRRLLETNKKIRLVLMSATLATKLYKEYFKVPSDPIHVGVRRFPIREYFVEDLSQFELPPFEAAAAKAIEKECEARRCNSAPTQSEMSKRFSLAARVATIVGTPGSSVLIFVPGMNEILAISEAIEKLFRPGIRYTCYPIHSDVPFEEQMDAFKAPEEDEVKVIIATNAAESSVTLPNVDHVICLGLCRQIMYNASSHRQILMPCWISRASALQRAGRTGRVRPGNVYRLYTRKAYKQYMEDFESGEMVRIPLDSVILMLKEMLHEEVRPVLMNCIEPPRIDTIERSFQSLYRGRFLSGPSDLAEITTLGSFVSNLGIDLAFGSFIGLGIQFGVAAEAIEMAAIMSFPKSPFQISSPLFHDPAEFNEITSKTYVAKCHFDANLYSEPLALMNALWDYHVAKNKKAWCNYYRFAHARISQLYSTRNSLRRRVSEFLGINETKLQVECPPVCMPPLKLTVLRVLKVWAFPDSIIECAPTKMNICPNGSSTISLASGSKPASRALLDQVLDKERHPYDVIDFKTSQQVGDFCFEGKFSLAQALGDIEKRLVSFMCETRIDLACIRDDEEQVLYLKDHSNFGPSLSELVDFLSSLGFASMLQANLCTKANRRGVMERKCGRWNVSLLHDAAATRIDRGTNCYQRFRVPSGIDVEFLIDQALSLGEISSTMHLVLLAKKQKRKKNKPAESREHFQIFLKGTAKPISHTDIKDLLQIPSVGVSTVRESTLQTIRFAAKQNLPYDYKGSDKNLMATSVASEFSTWQRPLFKDIPEGHRLLSILASSQRKGGHRLRFPASEGSDVQDTCDVWLRQEETCISRRWCRLGTDRLVFVHEDTVPASATSVAFPLYGCCANTLDLKGGAMKVESVTLLPPNPLFLLLCFLSFGLDPSPTSSWGSSLDSGGFLATKKHLSWLRSRISEDESKDQHGAENISRIPFSYDSKEAARRIALAAGFHNSCAKIGEKLVCFPEKLTELCNLFNNLDGVELEVWDSLENTCLTERNLIKWRKEKKGVLKKAEGDISLKANRTLVNETAGKEIQLGNKLDPPSVATNHTQAQKANRRVELVNELDHPPLGRGAQCNAVPSTSGQGKGGESNNQKRGGNDKTKWKIIRAFEQEIKDRADNLFRTEMNCNEQVPPSEFPSTNILALLLKVHLSKKINNAIGAEANDFTQEGAILTLNAQNWEIIQHTDDNGRILYQAKFTNTAMPVLPILGRGKNKLPKWMKKHMRPSRLKDVNDCVPPTISCPQAAEVPLSKDRFVLAFRTIEDALRMEAAFYLERQFSFAGKSSMMHWYDHSFDKMIQLLSMETGN